MKPTPCTVRTGCIAVNADTAKILERGPRIVAIEVDLGSKRASIFSWGTGDDAEVPAVWLERTEETLHTTRLKRETIVSFPEFTGWRVYLAEAGKYTLRVVLVKERAQ